MESFIKKIFDCKIDELVHLQFEKFGRGEYKDRAMILAKKSGNNYSLSTTSEFANELVRMMAEKLGEGKTRVTGIVVSTRDLSGELNFQDLKQFMGVKKYILDSDMSKKEILGLCDKFPKSFIGLSFKAGNSELKIKPKMPKSGKPSTKGEKKPKIDFCKLKTDDKNIVKQIIFDIDDFRIAEVRHTFVIDDLIIPKDEEDPKKMREMTKRKGKIIRNMVVDGKAMKKEVEFVA